MNLVFRRNEHPHLCYWLQRCPSASPTLEGEGESGNKLHCLNLDFKGRVFKATPAPRDAPNGIFKAPPCQRELGTAV